MLKKFEKDNSNGVSIGIVQNIIDDIEENIFEELTPKIIAERFFLR